jgi:hypothetical protein
VVSDHVRLATREKTRSARKKRRSWKQELAAQTVRFERERKFVAVHGFSRHNSFSALKEWVRSLHERGAAQLRDLLGVSGRAGTGRALGMNKGNQGKGEGPVLDRSRFVHEAFALHYRDTPIGRSSIGLSNEYNFIFVLDLGQRGFNLVPHLLPIFVLLMTMVHLALRIVAVAFAHRARHRGRS